MELIIDDIAYPIKDLSLDKYEIVMQSDKLGDAQIVALYTGLPVDKVKKAKFTNIKFIASFLREDLLNQFNPDELPLTLHFEGVNYGLIKPSEASFEEWINLEVFMAQKPLNLPLIAAHLYRPLATDQVGENRKLMSYDLEECQNRAEQFKSFPLKAFISALFFLTTFAKELMKNIQ